MPRFIQRLYPERIWAFSRSKNTVYLTFDDGPIAGITPWVLSELKNYNAKATFFCIGNNIKKNPEIFQDILFEGHAVGNHTFNHLNGWETKTSEYVENTEITRKIMTEFRGQAKAVENSPKNSELFRPPYGRITSAQAKILRKKGFKIVMWDVISFDYDRTITKEKCLQNVLKNIQPGSVVVFHDSRKAEKNLRYVLPEVLKFISDKGWRCSSIKSANHP